MASTADLTAQVAAAQQSASAAGLISARLQAGLAELTERVDQLEERITIPPTSGDYESPAIHQRTAMFGVVVAVPAGRVPGMLADVIGQALEQALGEVSCIIKGVSLTGESPAQMAVRTGLAAPDTLPPPQERTQP